MLDITIEQIEEALKEKGKKQNGQYLFQCPICQDSHKDNLVFDANKKLLKCFSCLNNEGAKYVLDKINEKHSKRQEPKMCKPQVNVWEDRQEQYLEYIRLSQDVLFNNQQLLDYIYNKRRLKKETLDICGVGFDDTENWFTIPIFSLKYDAIIDFELRIKSDKKQIKRIGGGCSTIAEIYGLKRNKTLYIVEGFVDGITLVQFLLDKKQKDFTVYSCSNGVNSLLNCLSEINFNNFKEIKLILDNDEAGNIVTKQTIEKYPFIKDCRKFLIDKNVKDINEWYKKGGEV